MQNLERLNNQSCTIYFHYCLIWGSLHFLHCFTHISVMKCGVNIIVAFILLNVFHNGRFVHSRDKGKKVLKIILYWLYNKENYEKIFFRFCCMKGLLKYFFFQNQSRKSMATEISGEPKPCLVSMMIDVSYHFLEQNISLMKLIPTKVMNWNVPGEQTGHWNL